MSHEISLETAVQMTTRYRNNRDAILKDEYLGQNILATCETFDKASIQQLLDQNGCGSFRIYYGMDEELKIHAIMVGADENGADILPGEDSTGKIMEMGTRCPVHCPPASSLNEN